MMGRRHSSMGASRTVRRCAGPCGKREASGGPPPAIWTPGDSTPLEWLEIGAPGTTWTTTGKTVATVNPGDPIGAVVPIGGPAGDWLQATAARRMTLGSIGSQLAAVHDHADDALSRTYNFPSAGAKTLLMRFQYNALIGTAESDVLVVVGGTTRGFQVRIMGPTHGAPGIAFAADITGPTISRRCSTWTPGTDPISLAIVYKGGGNTTTANYELWINEVQQTINTTGSSFDVSSASNVLCIGPTSSPVNGRFAKMAVVAEALAIPTVNPFPWLEAV